MRTLGYKHTPVLLKEVIEFLKPKSGEIFFDGTLGGGGYAEAILEASAPDGRLFGVDADDDAVRVAQERLSMFGNRVIVKHASYADVKKIVGGGLPRRGVYPERSRRAPRNDTAGFDGAVLDLGVSSHQLDRGERGFSFSKDGPLDMRMDRRLKQTAADIVNSFSCEELEQMFRTYGEERFAGRIARKIVEIRTRQPIKTTKDLEEICFVSYPPNLRKGKIHPATRVFQSLRIVVNSELDNLKGFLAEAPSILNNGGRLVIVSYHSLEDRFIKQGFKSLANEGGFRMLTRKPVVPSAEEISKNPRARSAKLRAVMKE